MINLNAGTVDYFNHFRSHVSSLFCHSIQLFQFYLAFCCVNCILLYPYVSCKWRHVCVLMYFNTHRLCSWCSSASILQVPYWCVWRDVHSFIFREYLEDYIRGECLLVRLKSYPEVLLFSIWCSSNLKLGFNHSKLALIRLCFSALYFTPSVSFSRSVNTEDVRGILVSSSLLVPDWESLFLITA